MLPARLQVRAQIDVLALATEERGGTVAEVATVFAVADASVQAGTEDAGLVELAVVAHEAVTTRAAVRSRARVRAHASVLTRLQEARVAQLAPRTVVTGSAGAREVRLREVPTLTAMTARRTRARVELLAVVAIETSRTLALVLRLRRVDAHCVVTALHVRARIHLLAPAAEEAMLALAVALAQLRHEGASVAAEAQDVALLRARVRHDDVVAPAGPSLVTQNDEARAWRTVDDVTTVDGVRQTGDVI